MIACTRQGRSDRVKMRLDRFFCSRRALRLSSWTCSSAARSMSAAAAGESILAPPLLRAKARRPPGLGGHAHADGGATQERATLHGVLLLPLHRHAPFSSERGRPWLSL